MALPVGSRRARKPLAHFFALILLLGVPGMVPGVRAQTPAPAATPQAQPQPSPSPQPKPPADLLSYAGDILPQRQRDLFVMRVDGTDKKQITHGFNVWFASWSPDGKRIAVTTEGSQLYTLKPDGSALNLIAAGPSSPAFWSPDRHFISSVAWDK